MKKALITGITGQDGSYLAEFLLEKGYEVHGMIRHVAAQEKEHRYWRIKHLLDKVTLHYASLESFPSVFNVIEKVKPDECYHLASLSFVSTSFEDEFSTFNSNINGTHYLLYSIKERCPKCKFYFAGTSEMYGNVKESPQNELTPFMPRSPYGTSKVAGFHMIRNYREAHCLFALTGILFNHESPRRGSEFVTRKITSTASKIKLGLARELKLGNLDVKRDFGFALDYVAGMWLMLQQNEPEEFVIASGKPHSIREILDVAFGYLNLRWEDYVVVDKSLYRPAEIYDLRGDFSKAKKKFGWEPKVSFEELIKMMVDADLDLLKSQSPLISQTK